jgi:hypothetical protein
MKAHALVPALALAAALVLPPLAEAGHRHGPGCGHRHAPYADRGRGYYDRGHGDYGHGDYAHGHGHGYRNGYGYSYQYRPYRPYGRRYGHSYAPVPYSYGSYGDGYEAPYGYYPPPPPRRPRFGIGIYFGF